MSGVPLKVFAAPTRARRRTPPWRWRLRSTCSNLDFVEGNGTFNETARSRQHRHRTRQGKVFPGERQTANLTLKPDTYERAKARGFRVLTQVNLPPGRYQMRVAAGNKAGKAGSVALRSGGAGLQQGAVRDERRRADVARPPRRRRRSSRRIRSATSCPARRRRCASSTRATRSCSSPSSTRTRAATRRTCSISRRSCAPKADAWCSEVDRGALVHRAAREERRLRLRRRGCRSTRWSRASTSPRRRALARQSGRRRQPRHSDQGALNEQS